MKKILYLLFGLILLSSSAMAQRGKSHQTRRFTYQTSIGFATGLGKINLLYDDGSTFKTIANNNINIQVEETFAYQFNNYFRLGLVTGFDFWKKTAFIPVQLHLHVNMIDRKVAPMAYLNLGYSFKWYMETTPTVMDRVIHGTKTGPSGEFGLGLNIRLTDRVGLNIAGCYKAQYSDIGYSIIPNGDPDYSALYTNRNQNVLYHFIGARVGISY